MSELRPLIETRSTRSHSLGSRFFLGYPERMVVRRRRVSSRFLFILLPSFPVEQVVRGTGPSRRRLDGGTRLFCLFSKNRNFWEDGPPSPSSPRPFFFSPRRPPSSSSCRPWRVLLGAIRNAPSFR